MKYLFWSLIIFFASTTPAADLKTCIKKFPSLQPLLEALAPFKQLEKGNSSRSFSEWVELTKKTEKIANEKADDLRKIGCEIKDTKFLDSCVKPLTWSCETTFLTIDNEIFGRVKRTKTEQWAYDTEQTKEASNLFAVCCNDFGCVKDGVGTPGITDEERTEALARLASEPSPFGDIALKSLDLSLSGLNNANCSCNTTADTTKSLVKTLTSVQAKLDTKSERSKKVSNLFSQIIARMKKGLPKKECVLEGGEGGGDAL